MFQLAYRLARHLATCYLRGYRSAYNCLTVVLKSIRQASLLSSASTTRSPSSLQTLNVDYKIDVVHVLSTKRSSKKSKLLNVLSVSAEAHFDVSCLADRKPTCEKPDVSCLTDCEPICEKPDASCPTESEPTCTKALDERKPRTPPTSFWIDIPRPSKRMRFSMKAQAMTMDEGQASEVTPCASKPAIPLGSQTAEKPREEQDWPTRLADYSDVSASPSRAEVVNALISKTGPLVRTHRADSVRAILIGLSNYNVKKPVPTFRSVRTVSKILRSSTDLDRAFQKAIVSLHYDI